MRKEEKNLRVSSAKMERKVQRRGKPVVKKRKGREMKEACLQHRAVTEAKK